MTEVYIIIVAAGTGSRFGSNIPKQFLPLGNEGKPVLMHTITTFLNSGISVNNIRIALHKDMIDFWEELCREHGFSSPPIVAGGETRFHSVRNALMSLQCRPESLILVHDGVRPLIPVEVIERIIENLEYCDAAIPTVPVTDSLRKIEDSGSSVAVDRAEYMAVQTPQGFKAAILFKAYNQPYSTTFTDDASVVESMGTKVMTVEGSYDNIKITTKRDLDTAQSVIKHRS